MNYNKEFLYKVKLYIINELKKYGVEDIISLFSIAYEQDEDNQQYVVFELEYGLQYIKVKRAVRYWERWLSNNVYSLKPTIITLIDMVIEFANDLKENL